MKRILVIVLAIAMLIPNVAFATNDPAYNRQYYIKSIQADKVMKYYKGKGVKVAILDSGYVAKNKDINYKKVIKGGNWTDSKNYYDKFGHGHPILSILASKQNNKYGISGLMPNAKYYIYKITYDNGDVYDYTDALIKAVDDGCDVISCSFSGSSYDEEERAAVEYAVSKGVIIVASAGNNGWYKIDGKRQDMSYPADFDGVIKVGSLDWADNLMYYSNWYVDCVAPGETIYCWRGATHYCNFSGTSAAAPMVTGLAIMCKQIDPSINSNGFMKVLRNSCVKNSDWEFNGPRDVAYGYGKINYYKAMKYMKAR